MTEAGALRHQSDGAFRPVDLEAELAVEESHDGGHDALSRHLRPHIDVAVVGIAAEAVAPPFQLLVRIIEQKVGAYPATGVLWTHEHGAQGGDEINIPEPGKNYGWPVITSGVDYSGAKIGEGTAKPGMERSIYYWDPSIAPSGMAFYTGDAFPAWKSNLFVGSLKFGLIARLELDGRIVTKEERLLPTWASASAMSAKVRTVSLTCGPTARTAAYFGWNRRAHGGGPRGPNRASLRHD